MISQDQLYETISDISALEVKLSEKLYENDYRNVSYKKQLLEILKRDYIRAEIDELQLPPLKLLDTDHTKLSIILIRECINLKRDYFIVLKFLSRIFFISYMTKLIPYPNKNVFDMVFSRLKSTHSFRNGIVQGLDRLCNTIYKRFQNIKNLKDIILLIYHLRTAISQSCRSFAGKYYILKSEPKKYVDRSYISNIVHDILSKRIELKIPYMCRSLTDSLSKIQDLSYNLIYTTIQEILDLFGHEVNNVKISKNLHNLVNTKRCSEEIGLTWNTSSAICIVNTILSSIPISSEYEQNHTEK